MTCLRCGGLVVPEYLFNPRQGSLSGFHGTRCVNCGAIHDDGICMNQRVPPSLKRGQPPVDGLDLAPRSAKSILCGVPSRTHS